MEWGNLSPGIPEAARCAGLDVYRDWKNPRLQEAAKEAIGVSAAGPDPAPFQGTKKELFWWNMITGPLREFYDPLGHLGAR